MVGSEQATASGDSAREIRSKARVVILPSRGRCDRRCPRTRRWKRRMRTYIFLRAPGDRKRNRLCQVNGVEAVDCVRLRLVLLPGGVRKHLLVFIHCTEILRLG